MGACVTAAPSHPASLHMGGWRGTPEAQSAPHLHPSVLQRPTFNAASVRGVGSLCCVAITLFALQHAAHGSIWLCLVCLFVLGFFCFFLFWFTVTNNLIIPWLAISVMHCLCSCLTWGQLLSSPDLGLKSAHHYVWAQHSTSCKISNSAQGRHVRGLMCWDAAHIPHWEMGQAIGPHEFPAGPRVVWAHSVCLLAASKRRPTWSIHGLWGRLQKPALRFVVVLLNKTSHESLLI